MDTGGQGGGGQRARKSQLVSNNFKAEFCVVIGREGGQGIGQGVRK